MLGGPALGAITIVPLDTDGSEVTGVALTVTGAPSGVDPRAVRLSDGVEQDDGSWVLTIEELATASLALPPGVGGDVAIRVGATSLELSNGDVVSTERAFTVRIPAPSGAADPPVEPLASDPGFDGLALAAASPAATLGEPLRIADLLPDLAETEPLDLSALHDVEPGDARAGGGQESGAGLAVDPAGGGIEAQALLASLQDQAATQLRSQTDHA